MKNIAALQSEIARNLADAPRILGNSGPKTLPGKQRVALNGVTHGLTGQNVFLPESEYEAYMNLGREYIADLRPVGVRETQLAQKIIDINWRLNTISAIENNLFHSARIASLRDGDPNDDRTVAMVSKARAWQMDCAGPNCFEKLGRHETRLQRSLLKITEEIERLQSLRLDKGDDTFVAETCPAWVWYSTMLTLHKQLKVAQAPPATFAAGASGSFASELDDSAPSVSPTRKIHSPARE